MSLSPGPRFGLSDKPARCLVLIVVSFPGLGSSVEGGLNVMFLMILGTI
jgi:hypothetical protein